MLNKTVTDETLVEGCLIGQPLAQKALYQKYGSVTFGICRRYTSDTMEAEDMHQIGWMKVFDRVSTFKNEGPLGAWIRKLFVNLCLSAFQKKKNRVQWLISDPENEMAGTVSDPTPPSDFLELEKLTSLISALPDGARLVFNLFAVEGMNHKEIAYHLNITEEASRQQLRRARLQLSRHISVETKGNYQSRTN